MIRDVKINVQEVKIIPDLHVLSLVGVDVVLGIIWLKSVDMVDYGAMTMKFILGGRKSFRQL